MDIVTAKSISRFDQNQDASTSDVGTSSNSVEGSADMKSSASGSNDINGSNSDLGIQFQSDNDEVLDDGDDYVDDYSDYEDFVEYLEEDDYTMMQSQFDNVDLPTGVEVPLPWMMETAPSVNASAGNGDSVVPGSSESNMMKASAYLAEAKNLEMGFGVPENRAMASSSSSSAIPEESSGSQESEATGILDKFNNFKQFETAADSSDHYYSGLSFSNQQPSKNWAKTIQEEWKILENDLPETIYVRVYEERMELLRAVIIGPSGTPYHDGVFVFDCCFPPNYPNEPPMVYYYSGGLRLNPNLYENGKVCLSLLGTWSGRQSEQWIPGKSTMLQVLVSVQALILNAEPYFNEPGYERQSGTIEGNKKSNRYSETAFIYSLKTMVYTLRRPPKYFEDFVIGHFHTRAHDILIACMAYYLNGATVASVVVKDGKAEVNNAAKNASQEFRATLRTMMNSLVTSFSRFASVDCEQFRT